MKNEIVKVEEQQLTSYLTAMGLAKNLKEEEKVQFLQIAQAYNLNPFKREIYVTKFGDNFSIIVGFEAYIKRAERAGFLQGWNVTTTGKVSDNSLKAIITIYRKDWTQPFIHEVYYAEYVQKTKAGEINKFWKEKPVTMTKKVAISQGFRMCFSDELGGMPYTAEEIVTEEQGYATVEQLQTPPTNLQLALDTMEGCTTIEELKTVWSNFKDIQKHPEFIEAKNTRKKEIEKEVANA
jgi:phage recombination protein Bet